MSEKSPLAELRELERRLAVRTARIDQLQAATESSHGRGLRFARTLLLVGMSAAVLTATFDPQLTIHRGLMIVLAATVGLLAIATWLCSFLVTWLAHNQGRADSKAARGLAMCVRFSRGWHPFPVGLEMRFARSSNAVGSRAVAVLLAAGAFCVFTTVDWLGAVVLGAAAAFVASGILRKIWSRQAAAPGVVELALVVVALTASVSMGASLGVVGSKWTIQRSVPSPKSPEHHLRTTDAAVPRTGPLQRAPMTYEAMCGASAPWSNVGSSRSIARLRETWLSYGAVIAGCPGPIHAASAGGEIVASVGISSSNGQVRSLGVADRNHGVLFVGRAAGVALDLTTGRSLRNVPSHLVVGGGDLYLVDTTQGTFVLVRRTAATPESREGAAEGTEEPSRASERPYVVVPPAGASLWMGEMRERAEWLWPEPSTANSANEGFDFVNQKSVVMVHASCDRSSGACERSGDHLRYLGGQIGVTAEELLRYAPSAE